MKAYCGFIEGYMATTDVDSAGDRLTPEAVESIKRQIDGDPHLRTVNLRHDTNQPIGEIVEWRIDTKKNWKGLWAKVGIYKDHPEVMDMVDRGELQGFSYTAGFSVEGSLESSQRQKILPQGMYEIRLEASPKMRSEIIERLKKEEVQIKVILRKAEGLPVIFDIFASSVAAIVALYEVWKAWKTREEETTVKSTDKSSTIVFNIFVGGQEFNFESNTVGQIIEYLERANDNEK